MADQPRIHGERGSADPDMTDEVVLNISERYQELYQQVTGNSFVPDHSSAEETESRIMDALKSCSYQEGRSVRSKLFMKDVSNTPARESLISHQFLVEWYSGLYSFYNEFIQCTLHLQNNLIAGTCTTNEFGYHRVIIWGDHIAGIYSCVHTNTMTFGEWKLTILPGLA